MPQIIPKPPAEVELPANTKSSRPASSSSLPQPAKKVREERLLAVGDHGYELWGYSDEEDMVDEPSDSDVLLKRWDGPLQRNEDEDEADTDVYAEQPTMDDAEILELVAPPQPAKVSTGKRKGKKAQKDEPDTADFPVKCWIKTGAANVSKSVTVQSTVSFAEFKGAIAALLNVRDTAVELTYNFSFVKERQNRSLASDNDWAGLLDGWSVELKEVVELMEVRAGAKKRVPTPVVRSVSTPVNDNMSAPSSNNQNNEVLKKLTRLNHALACSAHGGSYCLVPNKNTGATILQYGLKLEHLRISDSERRLWAEDMIADKATMHAPSEETLRKICARAAGTQNTSVMLAQAARQQRPVDMTPSRYEFTASRTIAATYIEDSEEPGTGNTSSLKDWLAELDRSPSRRHPSVKYADLYGILNDEKIGAPGDLVVLGIEGLKLVGVQLMIAAYLVRWAKADTEKTV
ncbi:hypothetical protein M408DRAFT_28601 [Serendipita vermifera MAFF 305830]|uniref:Uncharacterized protein n=1 Tax=Serendipita vermifera MAFF 305830 TaxID=933852 RepID=A0A0C3AR80_SERVB|nr:hypothetical protein M408DRAFT_28601 [Serendipita vermifera MAFF 305830]